MRVDEKIRLEFSGISVTRFRWNARESGELKVPTKEPRSLRLMTAEAKNNLTGLEMNIHVPKLRNRRARCLRAAINLEIKARNFWRM